MGLSVHTRVRVSGVLPGHLIAARNPRGAFSKRAATRSFSRKASRWNFEMSMPMVCFVIFASPILVMRGSSTRIRSGLRQEIDPPDRFLAFLRVKTAVDLTHSRSCAAKEDTIRPPPLPAMNGVAGSGSLLPREPLQFIRQGGSVCLNRFRAFRKWIPALITLPPEPAPAG